MPIVVIKIVMVVGAVRVVIITMVRLIEVIKIVKLIETQKSKFIIIAQTRVYQIHLVDLKVATILI